jgi:hypothetical protein
VRHVTRYEWVQRPLRPPLSSQINDKFDEQQQEKKAYYEEMNNSLLNIHCGVDDSHVDYVNVWKRQYDAAKDRCVCGTLCVQLRLYVCLLAPCRQSEGASMLHDAYLPALRTTMHCFLGQVCVLRGAHGCVSGPHSRPRRGKP